MMKYLKLFENFNDDLDSYDAKLIVIAHLGEVKEVEINPKWNAKNLLMFELLEEPTDDQIKSCKKHLFPEDEEKGFFLHRGFEFFENTVLVGIGSSIEDYCISWLNLNYSNMEAVKSKSFPGTVIYRYDLKDNVLLYDKTNNKVYVSYPKIWTFLEHYFDLDEEEIKVITEKWISETYNLNLPTTRFGTYYDRFEKCD